MSANTPATQVEQDNNVIQYIQLTLTLTQAHMNKYHERKSKITLDIPKDPDMSLRKGFPLRSYSGDGI